MLVTRDTPQGIELAVLNGGPIGVLNPDRLDLAKNMVRLHNRRDEVSAWMTQTLRWLRCANLGETHRDIANVLIQQGEDVERLLGDDV